MDSWYNKEVSFDNISLSDVQFKDGNLFPVKLDKLNYKKCKYGYAYSK